MSSRTCRRNSTTVASPYVHRATDGYGSSDLASPAYDIEAQDWFSMPLEADAGIWTPLYFDAGGGEIRMVTRAVSGRDGDRVFVIDTTDLPVIGLQGCRTLRAQRGKLRH